MIKIPNATEMKQAGYDDETVESVTNKTGNFLKNANHTKNAIENSLPIKKYGPPDYLSGSLNPFSQSKYFVDPVKLQNVDFDKQEDTIVNHEKKVIDDNKKQENLFAENMYQDSKNYKSLLPNNANLSAQAEDNYLLANKETGKKEPQYLALDQNFFYRTTGYIDLHAKNYTDGKPNNVVNARNNIWNFISSLSALTSNGKMKYSADGKKSGLWFLDQSQTLDYAEYYDSSMRDLNPDYKPDVHYNAFMKHYDGTQGLPDDQGRLMAGWFFNLPPEIVQKIINGDTNAFMDAYKLWEGYDESKEEEAKLLFETISSFNKGEDVSDKISLKKSSPRNAQWMGKPDDNNILNKTIGLALEYFGGQGSYNNFFAGTDQSYPGKLGRAGLDKSFQGYDKVSDYYKYINPERADLDANILESLTKALSHFFPLAQTYSKSNVFAGNTARLLGVNNQLALKAIGGYSSFSVENFLDQTIDAFIEQGLLDSQDLENWLTPQNLTKMKNTFTKHWTQAEHWKENSKAGALGPFMTIFGHFGGKALTKTVKGQTVNVQLEQEFLKKFDDPNFRGEFIAGKFYPKEQLKALFGAVKERYGMNFSYTTKDKISSLFPELGLTQGAGETAGSIVGLTVGQSLIFGADPVESFRDAAALIFSLALFSKMRTNYNKSTYNQYSNYGITPFTSRYAKNKPFAEDIPYIIDGQAGPRLYAFESAMDKLYQDAGIKRNVIWKMPINSIVDNQNSKVVDNIVDGDGDEFTLILEDVSETNVVEKEPGSINVVEKGYEAEKKYAPGYTSPESIVVPNQRVKVEPEIVVKSTNELIPNNPKSSYSFEAQITENINKKFNLKQDPFTVKNYYKEPSYKFNHKGTALNFAVDKNESIFLDVNKVKKDNDRIKSYNAKTAIEEFVRLQESNVVNKVSDSEINDLMKFDVKKYPKLFEYIIESGQTFITAETTEIKQIKLLKKLHPVTFETQFKPFLGEFNRDKKYNIKYVTTMKLPEMQTEAEIYRIDDILFMFPKGITKYFMNSKNVENDRKTKKGKLVKGITKKDKFEIFAVFQKGDQDKQISRILQPDNKIVKLILELNGKTIAQISPVEMTQAAKNMAIQVEKNKEMLPLNDPMATGVFGNTSKVDLQEKVPLPDSVANFFKVENSGMDLLDAQVLASLMQVDLHLKKSREMRKGYAGAFFPGIEIKETEVGKFEATLDKIESTFDFLEMFSTTNKFNPKKIQRNLQTLFHELGHAQSGLLDFATVPHTEISAMHHMRILKALFKRRIDKLTIDYDIPAEFNEDTLDESFKRLEKLAEESDFTKIYKEILTVFQAALPKTKKKEDAEFTKNRVKDLLRDLIVRHAKWKNQDLKNIDVDALEIAEDIASHNSYTFFSDYYKIKPENLKTISKSLAEAFRKTIKLELNTSNIFNHVLRRKNFIANIIDIENGNLKNDEFELDKVQERLLEAIKEEKVSYSTKLNNLGIATPLEKIVDNSMKVGVLKYLSRRMKEVFLKLDPAIQQSILINSYANLKDTSHLPELIRKFSKVAQTGKASPLFKKTALQIANLIQTQFANHGVYVLETVLKEAFRLSIQARPINALGKMSIDYLYTNWDISLTEDDMMEYISFTDADIKAIQYPKGITQKFINNIAFKDNFIESLKEDINSTQAIKLEDYYNSLNQAEKLVFASNENFPERIKSMARDQQDYRRRAEEVWADSFSLLTTNFELANNLAPNLTKLFFDTLERRPELKAFYDDFVFDKSGFNDSRAMGIFRQQGLLMKKSKQEIAIASQKIMKLISLSKRLLSDSDYRNLFLFQKLNSQYAQQFYLRLGAGRPGPSQDWGLWNPHTQRYQITNLNDYALLKIDALKGANTIADILEFAREGMDTVLFEEGKKYGLNYEVYESYLFNKNLVIRNKYERDDVIPGYVFLEQGMSEEQIDEWKEVHGDTYRSVERGIAAFEAEPNNQIAVSAMNKFFGPNGQMVEWMKRYMWNQRVMDRRSWNAMLEDGWYIALSNPKKIIEEAKDEIAPYNWKSTELGRTGRGFESAPVHVVSYTIFKVLELYQRHLKNDVMISQFGLQPLDGEQFSNWAKENGQYDLELSDELALQQENFNGQVGIFLDRVKVESAIQANRKPRFKFNTKTKKVERNTSEAEEKQAKKSLAKDWVTATTVRIGDVYPYLQYLFPIPFITWPIKGWAVFNKGEVQINSFDNLKTDELSILGKDLKRWKLSLEDESSSEEVRKYKTQSLKQDFEAITDKLDYDNQGTFMNQIRLPRLLRLEPIFEEVSKERFDKLPDSKKKMTTTFKKDEYGDKITIEKYEELVNVNKIYETTEDVKQLGLKVITMSDYKQAQITTKTSGYSFQLNSGEIVGSQKLTTFSVVVPDIFKFDSRVDAGNIVSKVASKGVSVFQAVPTVWNAAFPPANLAYDVGSIVTANNNAYQILSPWKMKLGNTYEMLDGKFVFTPTKISEKQPTTYTAELTKSFIKSWKLVFVKDAINDIEVGVLAEGLMMSTRDKNTTTWSGGFRENPEEHHLEYIKDIEEIQKMANMNWGENQYWQNLPEWVGNSINKIHYEIRKDPSKYKIKGTYKILGMPIAAYGREIAKVNKVVEIVSKDAHYNTLLRTGLLSRTQIQQNVIMSGVDFYDTAVWARNIQLALPFHKVINTIMKNQTYLFERDYMTGPAKSYFKTFNPKDPKTWKKTFAEGRFFQSGALNSIMVMTLLYVLWEYASEFGFLGQGNKEAMARISPVNKKMNIVAPFGLTKDIDTNKWLVEGYRFPAPPAIIVGATYWRTLLYPSFNEAAIEEGYVVEGQKDHLNPGLPIVQNSTNDMGLFDLYKNLMPAQINSNVITFFTDVLFADQITDYTGYGMIDDNRIIAAKGQPIFSPEWNNYQKSRYKAIGKKNAPSFARYNPDINDDLKNQREVVRPVAETFGVNRFLLGGSYNYDLAQLSREQRRVRANEQVIKDKVFKKYITGADMNQEDYNNLAIAMVKATRNKRLLIELKKMYGNQYDRNWEIILKSKSKLEMITNLKFYRRSLNQLETDAILNDKKREISIDANQKSFKRNNPKGGLTDRMYN